MSRISAIYITLDGVTKTLREWAEEKGISYTTVYHRYRKGVRGKALIKLFIPIGIRNGNKKAALKELWGKWVYVGT